MEVMGHSVPLDHIRLILMYHQCHGCYLCTTLLTLVPIGTNCFTFNKYILFTSNSWTQNHHTFRELLSLKNIKRIHKVLVTPNQYQFLVILQDD